MQYTLLLVACLVATALAWPQYKRERGVDGGGSDDRIDKCLERAEKCGEPAADQPARSLRQFLRDTEEQKACEGLVDDMIDDLFAKRDVGDEEIEQIIEDIVEVDEKCNCGALDDDEVVDMPARRRGGGGRGGDSKEDAPSGKSPDERRRECRDALEDIGFVVDGDDVDDVDNKSAGDNPPPPKARALKNLLRKLAYRKK